MNNTSTISLVLLVVSYIIVGYHFYILSTKGTRRSLIHIIAIAMCIFWLPILIIIIVISMLGLDRETRYELIIKDGKDE